MHSAASDLEWALRLSGQLETLSELAEHLTYRVLELEERLAAQDQQLSSLQTASDEFISDLGEAMEERMQQTENRFDIAIRGNGYFQILLPSGETAYTRDGTFGLSAEGTIVTAEGFTVQPAITIPPAARDVTINATGEVLAKIDGQVQPQNVGQIQLAIFANEGGLEAIGENLFLATPGSGDAQQAAPGQAGYGQVLQGFIETSNVNVVQEITALITAQRAYEMNSRVISASDEMLSTLTRLR